MGAQVIAHRNFNYDGRVLVPGQIIERGYYRNDESLLKRHYIEELGTPIKNPEHCDVCSRDFATRDYYDAHMIHHQTEKQEAQREKAIAAAGRVKKMEEEFPGGVAVEGSVDNLKPIKEV